MINAWLACMHALIIIGGTNKLCWRFKNYIIGKGTWLAPSPPPLIPSTCVYKSYRAIYVYRSCLAQKAQRSLCIAFVLHVVYYFSGCYSNPNMCMVLRHHCAYSYYSGTQLFTLVGWLPWHWRNLQYKQCWWTENTGIANTHVVYGWYPTLKNAWCWKLLLSFFYCACIMGVDAWVVFNSANLCSKFGHVFLTYNNGYFDFITTYLSIESSITST